MRKAAKILGSILAAAVIASVPAALTGLKASAATEYDVCGNFNNIKWDAAKSLPMSDPDGDGVYTLTVTITHIKDDGYDAGFKVIENKSWTKSYGNGSGKLYGDNVDMSAYKVGDTVTFTFDPKKGVPTIAKASATSSSSTTSSSTTSSTSSSSSKTSSSSTTKVSNASTGDSGMAVPAAVVLIGISASTLAAAKLAKKK